jgi:hypothetical protein
LQLINNKILFRVSPWLFSETYKLTSLVDGISLNAHGPRLEVCVSRWAFATLLEALEVGGDPGDTQCFFSLIVLRSLVLTLRF